MLGLKLIHVIKRGPRLAGEIRLILMAAMKTVFMVILWCWELNLAPLTTVTNTKYHLHWNGNVIILMKFSSLAALKVVILTTFGAASDENFIKMMTFSFQCISEEELLGPLLLTRFNFNPAWVSNYIHYDEWDEITKPFSNFNGATFEVWEWMSNFIPHLLGM